MSENERQAHEIANNQDNPLGCGHSHPRGEVYLAKEIAAAEERGRRAGIEERDELRARIDNALTALHAGELWSVRVANALGALAPRDSAPVCDCEATLWGGAHLASCAAYPRGSSCGADEDGIHREARRDRK